MSFVAEQKILNKLSLHEYKDRPINNEIYKGLIIDTETTGIDYNTNEIIELGYIQFEFDINGNVYNIIDTYFEYNDTKIPINEIAYKINKISKDMIINKHIDYHRLYNAMDSSKIIIAHNASFDRSFIFNQFPQLPFNKVWLCSQSMIDWIGLGYELSKLEWLLYKRNHYYDGHSVINDCLAVLKLIELPSPLDNSKTLLNSLINIAKTPSYYIYIDQYIEDKFKDNLYHLKFYYNKGNKIIPKGYSKFIYMDELNTLKEQLDKLNLKYNLINIDIYKRYLN